MAGGRKAKLFSRSSGGIYAVEARELTTGDIWYVGSTQTGASDTVGYGKTPDGPFATLDFAFSSGAVTASQGDIIFVMPGHAETQAATGELFDLDLAGIKVVGLGVGENRPTFNLTHADATCKIGAANCSIHNLRFVGNVSDLKTMLEVEAAAVGTVIDQCYFADSGTGAEALTVISVEANADRMRITNNHLNMFVGGEATDAIVFAGGSDGTVIDGNIIVGDCKTNASIHASAALSLNMVISHNYVVNAEASTGLCVKLHASTTGIMAYNNYGGSKSGTEPVSTVSAMHIVENFMTDLPNAEGIISATVVVWG